MTEPYEETVAGAHLLRLPPPEPHEQVCHRLHASVASCLGASPAARLLALRTPIEFGSRSRVCPDLALLAVPTGRPWFIAEVINREDHHNDTVIKKDLYEEQRLPRLWMIDPRYDNVEIYHGTPHGFRLVGIFAGREIVTESLLPGLAIAVADLFRQTD